MNIRKNNRIFLFFQTSTKYTDMIRTKCFVPILWKFNIFTKYCVSIIAPYILPLRRVNIFFVIFLPIFITNSIGMGDPFFCKYICPQGVLEGAIPLSLGNTAIRSALGKLFSFKLIILIMVILLSILFYRPFCKWICPLGAIYSLFNKISFLSIKVEDDKCVGCHQCTKVCKMDVDVIKSPNHSECIRCGACMKACPKDAIHYQFIKFNDK